VLGIPLHVFGTAPGSTGVIGVVFAFGALPEFWRGHSHLFSKFREKLLTCKACRGEFAHNIRVVCSLFSARDVCG